MTCTIYILTPQLSLDEVKGKLKTLTQGQKSDNIINLMANTFKALCELADWSVLTGTSPQETYTTPATSSTDDLYVSQEKTGQEISKPSKMNLHYNIQIHLPETTNMAVYDAIFQSLKKHLM